MNPILRTLILVLAFAVAIAIPGAIVVLYFGKLTYGVIASIIAAANVIVLAVPAYIVLAALRRVTFVTVCIAAVIVAALPIGWQLFPTGQQWMTTGIVGGGETAEGISAAGIWVRYIGALITAAGLGLAGGLGFWFVSRIGAQGSRF